MHQTCVFNIILRIYITLLVNTLPREEGIHLVGAFWCLEMSRALDHDRVAAAETSGMVDHLVYILCKEQ